MKAETEKNDQVTVAASSLVRALEACWKAIRAVHPELPDAVILVGPGDENPALLKWGHWAPARWKVPQHGHRSEVLIAGESLRRPARDTFETLLHEAAHGLAWARKIQDTSRQCRYHNQAYKKIAEEVGLTVKKHKTYGWTITSIPEETCGRYAAALALLESEIEANKKAHRLGRLERDGQGDEDGEGDAGDGEGEGDGDGSKRASTTRQCGCGRQIRVSQAEYLKGYIMCGICGKPFLTPGEADEPADRVIWLARGEAAKRSAAA